MARRRGTRLLALAVTLTSLILVPAPAFAQGGVDPSGVVVPTSISIMTFNIEYGGTVVDLDSILAAVRRADADVVAFNEVYGKVARLGRLTGYEYASRRLDLVSRYPLVDAPGSDGRYVFVQLAPGQVVAVTNVHLSSSDYGPRRLLDGWSRRKVLRTERRVRVPDLQRFVEATRLLPAAGIPTFIVGDLNSPSHQDYVEATVGLRPQVRFPVRWPVTRLLATEGFTDSWRVAHPDPVADEGLTWPAGRPRSDTSWNPRRDAPEDRIDQIWSAGPAAAVESVLVGERHGPGVDISARPWGSDHRAVVTLFDVNPGTPAVMVSPAPMLVEISDALDVTYHAPGGAGERVRIVPRDGDPVVDVIDSHGTLAGAPTDGTTTFPTGALASGAYDVVLIDGADAELARAPFWVREPDAPPLLDTRWRWGTGEPVEISFTQAPANRFDWIGLYERGGDPLVDYYIDYRYAGAVVEGSVTFGELPAGRYTVYYLLTDVYRQVASVAFVVRD
ncbi:MAG: endonuclease/exonuclease/phosphatase family protein [Actinomycetota bacterium]